MLEEALGSDWKGKSHWSSMCWRSRACLVSQWLACAVNVLVALIWSSPIGGWSRRVREPQRRRLTESPDPPASPGRS